MFGEFATMIASYCKSFVSTKDKYFFENDRQRSGCVEYKNHKYSFFM
jgi:hypothetical protein